jgi:hypothetical protein
MRQWKWRLDPFQTVLGQWKGRPCRRTDRQWMHCRADVVKEARQGEFGGTRSAANSRFSLDYRRAEACLGQNNSGR